MKKVPTIEPSYLTKNDFWDSCWLEKKYPERFVINKNESNKPDNK